MDAPVDDRPIGLTLRTLFGAAAFAALLGTAPAALRIGAAHAVSTVGAWVALACLVLGPSVLVQWMLRSAQPTMRALLAPALLARKLALVLAFTAILLMTAVFGAFLRRTTHHAGLAGTTFAIASALVASLAFAFALRLASTIAARAPKLLRWLYRATLLVAAILVALAASRVVREWGSVIADVGMLGAFSLLFGHHGFAEHRALAAIAPPLVVAIVLLGARVWWMSHVLPAALADHAPLYAALLGLLR
jgi:hypothetical protein